MKVTREGNKDATKLTFVGRMLVSYVATKISIEALQTKMYFLQKKLDKAEKKIEK